MKKALWTSALLLALAMVVGLSSCNDRPTLMPPSGGRLFEVLVVGDDSSIVRDVLQQDVPGLPQSEPQFDVSAIKTDAFKSTLRLSRCIVIVSVNPKAFDVPAMQTERNAIYRTAPRQHRGLRSPVVAHPQQDGDEQVAQHDSPQAQHQGRATHPTAIRHHDVDSCRHDCLKAGPRLLLAEQQLANGDEEYRSVSQLASDYSRWTALVLRLAGKFLRQRTQLLARTQHQR